MSEEKIDRKITVIFATDVVSYSKHMEANESGTVKNLRSCEKILNGFFEKHKGRLFNTGGDSFLAEFPSAVSAVECAVDFQNAIKERNSSEEATVKLQFRIGINSGDVIKEKENLLGDGVNIAARLEALAQTGGITISKTVYDFVKGKTRFEFNDLGVQKVKLNEFHAFDLLVDGSERRKLNTTNKRKISVLVITSVIFAAIVGYFALTFNSPQIVISEAGNRISLLIYPFDTQSRDKKVVTLATGINEQVSITLRRYNELYIFDKSSAEYFLKKKIRKSDLKDNYGVDYILESFVQAAEGKFRINLSLINLKKDTVVWSNRFDFEDADIFEIQDKISDAVTSAVIPGVLALNVADEKNEFTPQVYLNRLESRVAFETHTPEGMKKVKRFLEINRSLEPDNAYLDLDEAWLLMGELWFGVSTEFEKNVAKAYELTQKVLEVNPNYPYALSLATMIERNYIGKLETACDRLEKISSVSNDPSILSSAANLARHCGNYEKSILLFKSVLNKAPHFSLWFKKDLAWTYLMYQFEMDQKEFSDARLYILKQLENNYDEPGINELWHVMLAYIASIEGDQETALENVKIQSDMTNPIEVTWIKNYPNILNENKAFKDHFFSQLNGLGISL